MFRVLLDSKSHQALRHLGTETIQYGERPGAGSWKGQRLTGFQSALLSRGYVLEINEVNSNALNGAAVLIIGGRAEIVSFSAEELAAISVFCQGGGGLLLMSNHDYFAAAQNKVAEEMNLPIRFHDAWVPREKQRLILNAEHQISADCKLGLDIRTSCTMTLMNCPEATVLANNEDLDIGVFAVALEYEGENCHRIVAMTSAGHIASDDDSHTDLWAAADNSTWTLNIIDWLNRSSFYAGSIS